MIKHLLVDLNCNTPSVLIHRRNYYNYLCRFSGGGSGFIGTALTNALKQKGYSVRIISRKPGPLNLTWV